MNVFLIFELQRYAFYFEVKVVSELLLEISEDFQGIKINNMDMNTK